jgi:hypothetical protein
MYAHLSFVGWPVTATPLCHRRPAQCRTDPWPVAIGEGYAHAWAAPSQKQRRWRTASRHVLCHQSQWHAPLSTGWVSRLDNSNRSSERLDRVAHVE